MTGRVGYEDIERAEKEEHASHWVKSDTDLLQNKRLRIGQSWTNLGGLFSGQARWAELHCRIDWILT